MWFSLNKFLVHNTVLLMPVTILYTIISCYTPQMCAILILKLLYSSKNLQLIKTCKGNALSEMCISKNMRGGEIVYKEVQGGNDPDAALDKYNRECKGFSASYIQNRSHIYVTNSGFLYTFYFSGRNQFPLLLMDINGLQGPNKWGYDVFVFSLSKAKQYDSVFSLKPSTICHALDVGGYYTTDFFNYLYGQNAEL